jgi:hypothetical protein
MKNQLQVLILGLTMLFAFASGNHAAVHHVSQSGNNTTGTSWTNAFTTIQAALEAAVVGDEIWVAQGTYVINDVESQLRIKEGVNVYGGFSGSEGNKNARSNDASLTIISHKESVPDNFRLLYGTDLNDAAIWDGFTFDGKNAGVGVTLGGNSTLSNSIVKNCMAINGSGAGVYMSSSSNFIPVSLLNTQVINNRLKVSNENTFALGGAGVYIRNGSKMALIDGCTISNNTIEGISSAGNLEAMGAGIYIVEGTIKNTTIDSNKLTNSVNANYQSNVFTGGAIAIVPQKTDIPAKEVLIENCIITNSYSPSRGGAIIIDPRWSGQYHGNYTISKTVIANNRSNSVAGGILATAATFQNGSGWTINIENSIISNNSANGAGGGIFLNIGCVLNITNSTIVKNYAHTFGGGGLFMQNSSNHIIRPTLKNVLLWGNEAPGRATGEWQLRMNSQEGTMIFSAVQDLNPEFHEYANATLGDNLSLHATNDHFDGPGFIAPSSGAGEGVEDALSANWRLSASSILIDAGDDFLADDIDGTPRPQGDYSDIGAYEYSLTSSIRNETSDYSLVYAVQDGIMVHTTDPSQTIRIYTLSGTLVRQAVVGEGIHHFNLNRKQSYIVTKGGYSVIVL